MPGAGFKRLARRYAYNLDRCANLPYAFVKSQMDEKRHTPSFLSQCIQLTENDPQLDFLYKYAAVALYLGGADTVSAAHSTWISSADTLLDSISSHDLLPCYDAFPGRAKESPGRD